MHFEDLRQVSDRYDHVYLSPHLDDAALSCGGAIAQHCAQGARVLVVTLCTATPQAGTPFSALAREFHAEWGLAPDQVVAARLHEDALAMQRLGADCLWAGMLDALYRHPRAYNRWETLFGSPADDDPLAHDLAPFLAALRQRLPQAMWYAPLGVGSHVDHLITYAAVENVATEVAFYEDIPYVLQPDQLQQRLDGLEAEFVAGIVDVSAGMVRKLHAVAAYESQLNPLFGGAAAMEAQISAYAERLRPESGTYGERLWLRV